MKDFFGILFGLGMLFCLASLPSYLFFVFVGQYFQPYLGMTQNAFMMLLNAVFVSVFFLIVFWNNTHHRYHH